MNVLVVTKFYHPVIGGVETTVKELCEQFVKKGHRCTVMVMSKDRTGREVMNGVEVVRFPVDTRLLAGFNRPIWQHLNHQLDIDSYDVAYIHNFHIVLSLEAALFCKLRSLPYVFSPHYHGKGHTVMRDLAFKGYRLIGRFGLEGADTVIAGSWNERALLLKDFPSLADKCIVIPPGIKDRPKLEVPRRDDTILYVGRLMQYKGLDHVLDALKAMEGQGQRPRLRVVGTGPEQGPMEAKARQLGLADQIDWLGELGDDQLTAEYHGASCLVLLSSAEAYGLVVAEALLAGTPCVVTDKEALHEFLTEPGVLGVSYPPDPKEVAKVLSHVLREKNAIKVGPLSSRITSWSNIADRYLEVLARASKKR